MLPEPRWRSQPGKRLGTINNTDFYIIIVVLNFISGKTNMEKLESLLDIEVKTYLQRVKNKEEVRDLVSGNLTRETYARFLFTFYIIEFLSQRAVNLASINTKDSDPYLSKRFHSCAQGELGHAEIALRDLKDLGEKETNPFCLGGRKGVRRVPPERRRAVPSRHPRTFLPV